MLNKTGLATRLFFLNSGIAVASWAPMVPYVKLRLDLSESELGLILLLFGIGALIAMPLSGFFVHYYGTRKLIPIGNYLLALTIPLLTLTPNAITLSCMLFMFGAILGILNVSVNSHAIEVEKQMQRPMMSSFHCLFSSGGLIGALAMTFLLETGIPIFYCTLFLSLSISAITFFQSKHLLNTSGPAAEKTNGFSFPQPIVLFLGLMCMISFLSEGAILDWGAILLRSTHDYDISIAGIGYAFFAVAMALGRWGGDSLKDYFGDLFMIRAGAAFAAAGILIAVSFNWAHMELLGFFMVGLGAANIVPTLFSAAGRINGTSPSLALTTMTTLGYAGLLFGPAVIGFVANAFSLPIALSGVAALLGFIAIFGKSVQAEQEQSVLESG